MQKRPGNRGELGWREALAANKRRLPRGRRPWHAGGPGRAENPVCVGVISGTPGRRKRRTGRIPRSVLERSEMTRRAGEGTDSLSGGGRTDNPY